ncbi:MAG TPA: type II toxin-antitoxin system PemK/MazF family toxin [Stellaceae bacterium]
MAGDYGKPRPAIIVQTDAMPERHASVVICPMTSNIETVADFRLTIEPTSENGLRVRSHIMADKPTTVRRERIGRRIGYLTSEDMSRVNIALAFVMGIAD